MTSATSAKKPRWGIVLKATPMPVPLGSVRLPQPDFSRTRFENALHPVGIVGLCSPTAASTTTARRGRSSGNLRGAQEVDAELERVLAGRVGQFVDEGLHDECEAVASRCTASIAVGTYSGMYDDSTVRFGTKRAGNSVGLRSACEAGRPFAPKVTKWFFQATRLPLASTPPLRTWKPPGR